jgi:hypothetical protein
MYGPVSAYVWINLRNADEEIIYTKRCGAVQSGS